ncbi:Terpene synthase [Macleaya cordata]|uniref:Terpene synthase n=1 Tax=Macleaya cordata TaxID=56857 RepID=A0A200Q4R4_MACCD|nr:Terpene synthase [Macleaya cordata]
MASLPTLRRLPTSVPGTIKSSLLPSFLGSSCVRSVGARDKQDNFRLLCSTTYKAISKPQAQVQIIEWEDITEQDEREEIVLKVLEPKNVVKEWVERIKSMLSSMNDGEISISAYDTAWVALVEDIYGSASPQFPSSIQWIVENQLPDGSWGDRFIFSAHDRIISTLACVIALKAWNIYPTMRQKGLSFIRQNMCKLDYENTVHMPIGFEVVFPSLIEIARELDIEVPDEDSSTLQDIHAKRKLKLTRIPKEMMHIVPTTLLHSLEGMPDLDWQKLLKLQCLDGSFLFSPSSTAFALMQTKDQNCLQYLQKAVQRFNGGVPNVYPVDLFEHIWVVDRLERLGISRYFQSEIKECMNYVYRYWTENGICWARNSRVNDIDDTAMGFRLLRLHGHDVSAEVFQHFEKEGEFFCFRGQSNQAVTGMFNLYRASQVSFPGETILQEAKSFSSKFLRKKQASNQLLDKWIITKDLPGEVGYALDVPWYASLPRIETRFYIEQYGGDDDVWIGKTLYRMPIVNNNIYLELAKLDFNNCQALHQLEWLDIQKWYIECNLELFGVDRRTLVEAYFLAMASIFEPERSSERLAWTQTAVLIEAVSSYFEGIPVEHQRAFVHDFVNSSCIGQQLLRNHHRRHHLHQCELIQALVCTLNQLSLDLLISHGSDIRHHLRRSWETFLLLLTDEGKRQHGEAFLLVRTITLCAGRSPLSEDDHQILLSHPTYNRLISLTNSLSYQLLRLRRRHRHTQKSNKVHKMEINSEVKEEDVDMLSIESDMQELVKCVLQSSDGIDRENKQTFLNVVKSYFYAAYCSPATIEHHIAKVLFERVA